MKKQIIAFVADDCKSWRVIDKSLFLQFLSDFGSGTKLKLTIENYRPQRSLSQNNVFYWWVDLLSEELSIETERLKEVLKYKFLRRPVLDSKGEEMVDEETGEVEWYVPSTTELDKLEYSVFLDKIFIWAQDFANTSLPLPDENYKINFQEEHKKKLINK